MRGGARDYSRTSQWLNARSPAGSGCRVILMPREMLFCFVLGACVFSVHSFTLSLDFLLFYRFYTALQKTEEKITQRSASNAYLPVETPQPMTSLLAPILNNSQSPSEKP